MYDLIGDIHGHSDELEAMLERLGGKQVEEEPKFVSPSRIYLNGSRKIEPIYRYGDLLLAVAIHVGEGRLIVIGDSRWFNSRNTEGIWGWWAGNLRLQHDILVTYCGGDADRVKELFPPPTKPDE